VMDIDQLHMGRWYSFSLNREIARDWKRHRQGICNYFSDGQQAVVRKRFHLMVWCIATLRSINWQNSLTRELLSTWL
jgi:hypothetical protein